VPFITRETRGRVVILTMNKPEARNALSTEEECIEFAEACEAANADHGISCVIVTGAGDVFSAGGDLKAMRARTGLSAGDEPTLRWRYRRGVQRLARALYALEMPAIAAVNGPAVGAGFDMTCFCDIRIAAPEARFAESFVKVGLVPGDGGAWILQRTVGRSKAAEMTFTGDLISADEALRIGLVSAVVPRERLLDEALALAGRITANPPAALRAAKRLMREAQSVPFETHLEAAAHAQALAHHSPDHAEAVAAFLEKRVPTFGPKPENE